MQVTAIIQNNTLIIPNLDLSQLAKFADKNGLIEIDLPILDEIKQHTNISTDDGTKLSVQQLLGEMTIQTNKVATIDDMNDSIAKAYEKWEN